MAGCVEGVGGEVAVVAKVAIPRGMGGRARGDG